MAAFDAAEADAASWSYRIKSFFAVGLGSLVFGYVLFALLCWQHGFVPNSWIGLKMQFGASCVLAMFLCTAYQVEQWLGNCVEWYWFWRVLSTVVFLLIAAALLYFLFHTADVWLPHFRE